MDPKEFVLQSGVQRDLNDVYKVCRRLGYMKHRPWSMDYEDWEVPEDEPDISIKHVNAPLGHSGAITISVEPSTQNTLHVLLRDIEGRVYEPFGWDFTLPANLWRFLIKLEDELAKADSAYDLKQAMLGSQQYKPTEGALAAQPSLQNLAGRGQHPDSVPLSRQLIEVEFDPKQFVIAQVSGEKLAQRWGFEPRKLKEGLHGNLWRKVFELPARLPLHDSSNQHVTHAMLYLRDTSQEEDKWVRIRVCLGFLTETGEPREYPERRYRYTVRITPKHSYQNPIPQDHAMDAMDMKISTMLRILKDSRNQTADRIAERLLRNGFRKATAA